jgi:hypothetical protein
MAVSMPSLYELLSACIPRDHSRQTNAQQLLSSYVSKRSKEAAILNLNHVAKSQVGYRIAYFLKP